VSQGQGSFIRSSQLLGPEQKLHRVEIHSHNFDCKIDLISVACPYPLTGIVSKFEVSGELISMPVDWNKAYSAISQRQALLRMRIPAIWEQQDV
jgi:hypothetical protein